MQTAKGLKFRIQVSPRNCVGCGVCVTQCPGKAGKKALVMEEAKTQFEHEEAARILYKEITPRTDLFPTTMVKGAAFLPPYQEVSGACAGCGETHTYRLVSQLFGRDMLVANATGCSSIYNGSTPLTAFVTDKNGEGVAWANSLFEDNAEFGFGMRVATDFKLDQIVGIMTANREGCEPELQALIDDYIANIKDKASHPYNPQSIELLLLKQVLTEGIKAVLEHKADLLDKSVWIVGGDGWSYDIGYGGLITS